MESRPNVKVVLYLAQTDWEKVTYLLALLGIKYTVMVGLDPAAGSETDWGPPAKLLWLDELAEFPPDLWKRLRNQEWPPPDPLPYPDFRRLFPLETVAPPTPTVLPFTPPGTVRLDPVMGKPPRPHRKQTEMREFLKRKLGRRTR
jgi:hypothetical protein